jgi:outer membrane protein OmpA-like peptidoglycan-associated protein
MKNHRMISIRGSLGVIASVLLALFAALPVHASDKSAKTIAPGKRLSFVSCPIVRDTEMVPCWLAEYEGELYYLGIQLDLQSEFFPPQLKHEALVEGVVSDKPRICGGIVLEPVKVSSLPEINLSCNTILPAEGYKIENARRGTGPDPDTLSARNQARARQVEQYKPPYTQRTYTVYFDFDSTYMPSRSTRVVTEVMRYATAIDAKHIQITGYRGSALLTNGKKMVEKASLPEIRVKNIESALVDLGVKPSIISTKWSDKPEKPDGIDDFETRRVVIVVTP